MRVGCQSVRHVPPKPDKQLLPSLDGPLQLFPLRSFRIFKLNLRLRDGGFDDLDALGNVRELGHSVRLGTGPPRIDLEREGGEVSS